MIPLPTKRFASVIVKNGAGATILDTGGENRVVFSFHTGMDGKPNEGNIRIYGLDDADEQNVMLSGVNIQLIAGSETRNSLVFSGDLISAFSEEVDQQKYIQISAADGDSFYSSYIGVSVGAGETIGGLVEKVISRCSVPIEAGFITSTAYKTALARGVSVLGSPVDVVKAAARSLNATMFVLNGMLYLICDNDKISDPVIMNDQDLIGIPVVDNWYSMFKVQIDSALSIGQFVVFSSEYGRGVFRVVSVDGIGDTRDGEWCLKITSISQNQNRPSMTAVTSNIWR